MSDPIATPPKTPEQVAADAERQKRADAINARVAELKKFEGKTFARNDGKGLPVKVEKYAGICVIGGVATYMFVVEIKGHAVWNEPATAFLENYHVVEVLQNSNPTNDLPV